MAIEAEASEVSAFDWLVMVVLGLTMLVSVVIFLATGSDDWKSEVRQAKVMLMSEALKDLAM